MTTEDERSQRAYADDMGFVYCEMCGAIVIPDGSDDPAQGHVCPVSKPASGSTHNGSTRR